ARLDKYCYLFRSDFSKPFSHSKIFKFTIDLNTKDTYFERCNSWNMAGHYTELTLFSLKNDNFTIVFVENRTVRSNYIKCNCCHVLPSRFRLLHLADALFRVHLQCRRQDGKHLQVHGRTYLQELL